jgi:hypothetical protein
MSSVRNEPEVFRIPPHSRDIKFPELPLSARLEAVLQRTPHRCLGDIDGLSPADFSGVRRCGAASLQELINLVHRVQTGEFTTTDPQFAKQGPVDLVRLLDEIFPQLAGRDREILLLRHGGRRQQRMTLAQIGSRYGLTRERVRQVLELIVHAVRRWRGPRLPCLTGRVADKCFRLVCPLTPELMAQWLRGGRLKPRYPARFYVSLVGELDPGVPAWPKGQEPQSLVEPATERISAAVEEVLKEGRGVLPLHDAYTAIKPRDPGLSARDFLTALKHCWSLRVEFPSPMAPQARLRRLKAAEVAKAVLQASPAPCTVDEIIRRGRALFGKDLVTSMPRAMANSLTPSKGFYLLGPRAYGLRQHFRLPEARWAEACDDVCKLLQSHEQPIHTFSVVRRRKFSWTERTNPHELAQILRSDKRLTDLGRFWFALGPWGIEKRESITNLLPEVLTKAGRPIPRIQILGALRERWPVSSRSFNTALSKHQQLRAYGFDYYGLAAWGEAGQLALVGDPPTVERMVKKGRSMSLGELCQELAVPAGSPLADKLWETCAALSTVRRTPDKRTPHTKLTLAPRGADKQKA